MFYFLSESDPEVLRDTLILAMKAIHHAPLAKGHKTEHIHRLHQLVKECDIEIARRSPVDVPETEEMEAPPAVLEGLPPTGENRRPTPYRRT